MGVLLWAACGVYLCVALAWLFFRGLGSGRAGGLDKAVVLSFFVALGAFVALMLTLDYPYGGVHLPWWRLFRGW